MFHSTDLTASIQSAFPAPMSPAADVLAESMSAMLRALEVAGGDEFAVSILMLNQDATTVRCLAAPSLPKAYCEAINGSSIGPNAGSCGTAAFLGKAVFVDDIATDPRWAAYKDLALSFGLRACWSTPIESVGGKVIGTFAVYHHEPRAPTPAEVQAVGLASQALTPLLVNAARV